MVLAKGPLNLSQRLMLYCTVPTVQYSTDSTTVHTVKYRERELNERFLSKTAKHRVKFLQKTFLQDDTAL